MTYLKNIAISAAFLLCVGTVGIVISLLIPVRAQCITQVVAARLNLSEVVAKLADQRTEKAGEYSSLHLRTDLKGTRITIALPENAPDKRWDNALLNQFEDLTGIHVEKITPGNDTTAVLSSYLSDLGSGVPKADVYSIDIVWPGILSQFAEDLRPTIGASDGIASTLIENDAVGGTLVAIPYFTEVSLLYYRTDLLAKYHFAKPPATWSELEHQARMIEAGERSTGHQNFWGYLWQGYESEALTCNALEWQISEGGGQLLNTDGTLSLEPVRTAKAWERARGWIGTLSPPDVTHQLEDDSLRIWKDGRAAFMRNWPYAYRESQQADSKVQGNVGVAILPRSNAHGGRHADVVGGFQLMVSNRSPHKAAAIELVRFLTSPQVQRFNAVNRGYAPTRPDLYEDPAVLVSNPFFGSLKTALVNGAVTRPSTIAGARYGSVSAAYFRAAHATLTGDTTASDALSTLAKQLHQVLAN